MSDCPFRERPVIKYLGHVRPTLTACPTCGRCQVRDQFYEIAHKVEEALSHINSPAHVAVMGCAVNGPGEASDADIGVACGKGNAVLFQKGQKIKSIPADRIVEELLGRLPYILVPSTVEPTRWLCWADMSCECTSPESIKPCHSLNRGEYVKNCDYRKGKWNLL